MSFAAAALFAPLAVWPWGVARSYHGFEFGSAARAELEPALPFRPGQTCQEVSRKNRQEAILEDLRAQTTRLAEGFRLFSLPNRSNLALFRTAESSAPDQVTAGAEDGAPTGLYHVQVKQLALGQTNTSLKLNSLDEPPFHQGEYIFDLEVNGETTQVAVEVVRSGRGQDDNLDLLHKIGRQIMAADERLEAEVITTMEPGENNLPVEKAALTVRSKWPGRQVTFALTDASGDLVEKLKLDQSGPAAAPAQVHFNHQAYYAETNELTLDEAGLTLGLLQPTGPNETIKVKEGLAPLVSQTQDLISQLNDYLSFLKKHRRDIKTTILLDIMTETDAHLRRLKDIGLLPAGDGRLMLADKYAQALEGRPEYVYQVLSGEDGFFTKVEGLLDEVLSRNLLKFSRIEPPLALGYQNSSRSIEALRTGLILSVSV